jgi:hypothetical protein
MLSVWQQLGCEYGHSEGQHIYFKTSVLRISERNVTSKVTKLLLSFELEDKELI